MKTRYTMFLSKTGTGLRRGSFEVYEVENFWKPVIRRNSFRPTKFRGIIHDYAQDEVLGIGISRLIKNSAKQGLFFTQYYEYANYFYS